MAWPVYLFVPNLIGYVRVITGVLSFLYAFTDAQTAGWLYAFSYALDAVDGVAARRLKQTSRWGAVLDMLTDRACTAALLCIRAMQEHQREPGSTHWVIYVYLMLLDVVSHWAQMYSSLSAGSASHKNVKNEHPIIKFYYSFPYALFAICLFNEAALLMGYVMAVPHYQEKFGFVGGYVSHEATAWLFTRNLTVAELIYYVSYPVFILKQIISVVQMFSAIKRILDMDENDRKQQ